MIELLFEYMLSVMDYTMLLYFFLMLISYKWQWKKAMPAILMISLLQLMKDYTIYFGGWSIFIDCFIVVLFLFLYSYEFTYLNLLCAMLVYSIFKCCIVLFVGTATMMMTDVHTIMVFGWERYVFSIILKLFILIVYFIVMKPLKTLKNILSEKILSIMFIMISFILTVISYIYGIAVDNESILFYVVFTLFMFICTLYLIYHYCVVINENENLKVIRKSMDLTAQYAKDLEKEYEQIRKIRHDMKNQLLVLSDLQKDKRYEEVNHILTSLTKELNANRKSISGNIYVDAVLRQKQEQYKRIKFELSISLKSGFEMEPMHIISLLSNIIDNACEELDRIHENYFKLTIRGNSTDLDIIEWNPCREHLDFKTDKDTQYHGYGLRIISEIVKQYDGQMFTDTENGFSLKIMLMFKNSTLTA